MSEQQVEFLELVFSFSFLCIIVVIYCLISVVCCTWITLITINQS